jgi:hypothetical protein
MLLKKKVIIQPILFISGLVIVGVGESPAIKTCIIASNIKCNRSRSRTTVIRFSENISKNEDIFE